jgi:pre-mRNA-processing factor SLU7
VRGQERAVARSKYEEDVFINNHTSVWGSYWEDFHWGYACCHSFVKQSYCTGGKGRSINRERSALIGGTGAGAVGASSAAPDVATKSLTEQHREKATTSAPTKKAVIIKPEDDVKSALKRLEADERAAEELLSRDERKRPYNSLKGSADRVVRCCCACACSPLLTNVVSQQNPSDADMEAFRLKRVHAEDPMAQFMGGGGGGD